MKKLPALGFEDYAVKILILAFSLLFIALFFYTSVSRIAYPFALEWVEANTIVHTLRVVHRQHLYIPPSFEFTPTIYPPLYYYLSSFYPGNIMLSMRIVSFLSTIAIMMMIYKICRFRGLNPLFGFGAVGLFAASYSVTGYWYDVARVDMLFLALIAGVYTILVGNKSDNKIAGLAASILTFLAFTTKQNALAVVPFAFFYFLINKQYKALIIFIGGFVVLFICYIFYMNWRSDGCSGFISLIYQVNLIFRGNLSIKHIGLFILCRDFGQYG